MIRIENASRGTVLATRAQLAGTWWTRTRGLVGYRDWHGCDALVLRPCRGLHTIGMRMPIDVLLLDRAGHVQAVLAELRPGRIVTVRSFSAAVELPAGTIIRSRTVPGDLVRIVPEAATR